MSFDHDPHDEAFNIGLMIKEIRDLQAEIAALRTANQVLMDALEAMAKRIESGVFTPSKVAKIAREALASVRKEEG